MIENGNKYCDKVTNVQIYSKVIDDWIQPDQHYPNSSDGDRYGWDKINNQPFTLNIDVRLMTLNYPDGDQYEFSQIIDTWDNTAVFVTSTNLCPDTDSPTDDPTNEPTISPTTKLPTKSPTKNPTLSPTTLNPTNNPSKTPSNDPTKQPTSAPTYIPTTNPSKTPTNNPTSSPITSQPTTSKPTTASPTTSSPITSEPTTSSPTTSNPTTAEPTTLRPTTLEPTTALPTTNSPNSASPTSVSPASAKPTTDSPTTISPTTYSPTTSQPTTSSDCEFDPADCIFYTIINYESPTQQYANLNDDCVSIQRSLLNLSNETNWYDTDEWIALWQLIDGEWEFNVNVNITLYWNFLYCDKQQSIISYLESGNVVCILANIFGNVSASFTHLK